MLLTGTYTDPATTATKREFDDNVLELAIVSGCVRFIWAICFNNHSDGKADSVNISFPGVH
jgi:hypothetical protein